MINNLVDFEYLIKNSESFKNCPVFFLRMIVLLEKSFLSNYKKDEKIKREEYLKLIKSLNRKKKKVVYNFFKVKIIYDKENNIFYIYDKKQKKLIKIAKKEKI